MKVRQFTENLEKLVMTPADVLLRLKEHLNENRTGMILNGWDISTRDNFCQQWERITCDDGHFAKLDLSQLDLTGSLPDGLEHLHFNEL